MSPRILSVLVGLAVLAGCDDSSSSNENPTPGEGATCTCIQVIDTGTYSSSYLEKISGFTYREQITFSGDGTFEFVDYETLDESGKITSYTKFLGRWSQADSTITLSRSRSIYHTTLPGESNTDEALDPPSPLVLGTNLRITSPTTFSLLMTDYGRVEYTKAPKIQFTF